MAKISVIVPIFNTGKILNKTLKSIQKQTFEDFECLLIDDGSEKMITSKICKQFVKTDLRFKYFKKNNEGIEKTRLFGVENSNTDLLIFCDHDDYYELNAFEKLYESYSESNADIVCANCYSQKLKDNKITRTKNHLGIKIEMILNHREFIQNYFLNFFGIHTFPVSANFGYIDHPFSI